MRMNKINIRIFKAKDRTKLNNNLPVRTAVESEDNFNAMEVSLSSSFTKVLESPLDVEKKIDIHKSPVNNSFSVFSSPRANLITDIVTSTNIKSEFITYRVLNSDFRSFLKISIDEFRMSPVICNLQCLMICRKAVYPLRRLWQ